jgi:hypothetical protein
MQSVHSMRRTIVLLCVAAVLFAALTPAVSGLLCAILVPFWFFVAVIVSFRFREIEKFYSPQAPLLAHATSRAPPAI